MITLRIRANIVVEGASSKEVAIEAVMGLGSGAEILDVTRTGSDESPVYVINIRVEEDYTNEEAVEEAAREAEAEKKEFSELGDEAAEEAE